MNAFRIGGLMVLVAILVLDVGCEKHGKPKKERSTISVDPATVAKVVPATVDDLYRCVGTVVSKTTSEIAGKVMGHVACVKVKEGDRVEKGDLLIELRSQELKSRLEAAKNSLLEIERTLREAVAAGEEAGAQLALAEATYERYQGLTERQSVSLQEFDEVTANYEVAKARVRQSEEAIASLEAKKNEVKASMEEAKTYYAYTRIEAPFSGIITQKMIDEGDLAMPGNTLLVLEVDDQYQLAALVDESKAGMIQRGDELKVVLEALGQENMRGKVSEIIPHVDPATRTFEVKINLPQVPGLKSGMYGKAYFPVGKASVLLVPKTALAECGQLTSVYVVGEDGVVRRRLVKTGKAYDGSIEILSGITGGESVVMRDLFKVTEGCSVGKAP